MTDAVVTLGVGFAFYALLAEVPNRLESALRLTLLGYALVQSARFLHELGHALGGLYMGRPARRLVWTALTSYCDFQPETEKQRGQIPDPLPAVIALAGPPVNGVLGALTLAAFLVAGDQWDRLTRELVCFLGWVNVAALCNLLPVPGYDGAYVWRGVWKPRPRELAHVPGLLVMAGLIVGGTSWMVPGGAVSATFSQVSTWVFLAVAIGFALIARRLLIPCPPGNSQIEH